MRKIMLLTGAAALAVAMPGLARPDDDRGRGRGGDRAEASHPGKGNGRGNDRAERRHDRAERARDRVERRAERREGEVERRAERRERTLERRAERIERRADRREESRERRRDWAERRWDDDRDRRFDRSFDRRIDRRGERRVRVAARDGCPPGLAMQNAFCLPPGQLRKLRRAETLGRRLPVSDWRYNIPDRYRYRFADGDDYAYRWDDGYVYRLDRRSNLVDAVIPVLATGLLAGERLPLGYEAYNVPLSYRPHYPDSGDAWYRYDDNAIYEVDPASGLVEGIVALLTGSGGLGGLGVGDRLPAGYDVYNVPLDYRDRYVDGDDAWYRYADNSIYQVDPTTQLIEAVISLVA